MISQEELEGAIVLFHQADEMEKKAGALRKESRATIIQGYREGMFQPGKVEAGGKTIKFSVPKRKSTPAMFNQDKAEEFHVFCEDTHKFLLAAFTITTTYEVNFEVLTALMKTVETDKYSLIARIEGYLLPAIEGKDMEPRIQAS